MASSDDFSTLREQAMRRMRQMYAGSTQREPIDIPPVTSENIETQAQSSPPKMKAQRRAASPLSDFFNSIAGLGRQNSSNKSIFDDLNIDEDKAVIGILIYILYKNGGDIKLMLALGYLLI